MTYVKDMNIVLISVSIMKWTSVNLSMEFFRIQQINFTTSSIP